MKTHFFSSYCCLSKGFAIVVIVDLRCCSFFSWAYYYLWYLPKILLNFNCIIFVNGETKKKQILILKPLIFCNFLTIISICLFFIKNCFLLALSIASSNIFISIIIFFDIKFSVFHFFIYLLLFCLQQMQIHRLLLKQTKSIILNARTQESLDEWLVNWETTLFLKILLH